jgi:hypothetical protein
MALVNECIPYKEPGASVTARCSAAVKGKRLVKVSGNRTGGGGQGAAGSVTVGVGLSTDLENLYKVAQCVAKDQCIGVSGWDSVINGEVKVFLKGKGIVLPITAGAAIAAGAEVESDAEGRVITLAAGKAIGYCMTAVAAEGEDAEILLY